MSPWLIWLCAAVLLLVCEVLSQAAWAFCFAVGCLAAMAVSFVTDSALIQALVVALGAVVAWVLLAPLVRRLEGKRDSRHSRTGMDALLGRRAVVTDEIRPGQTGRARIDGDSWQVVAPGAQKTVRPGTEVSVSGYDSIVLTVEVLES